MDNIKIQGTLTSRIETRHDKIAWETYHYGFFQIPGQNQEIPVVFKSKPDLRDITHQFQSGYNCPEIPCCWDCGKIIKAGHLCSDCANKEEVEHA